MQQEIKIESANPIGYDGALEFNTNENISPESINKDLMHHQISTEDWDHNSLAKDLHLWAERFIFEFKLKTSTPAIMIDDINHNWYGRYTHGRNGFGLCNEIAINKMYLGQQKYWEILGTLLHELLHAEQEQTGKPGSRNYHTKPFRDRADTFGLIVSPSGYTQYSPAPSPFWNILGKYGIKPEGYLPPSNTPSDSPIKHSKSKLRLWICQCKPQPVHVRVAISDFQAMCLKCNTVFRKAD
jgi:predicted SprT family Zn-dependent metalloprotease